MACNANGCTIAVSSGIAVRTASRTKRCDLPFMADAPWRASNIIGNVSPMVLNARNINDSSGTDPGTNAAARNAAEITGPVAVFTSVRSRSIKAADAMGQDATPKRLAFGS